MEGAHKARIPRPHGSHDLLDVLLGIRRIVQRQTGSRQPQALLSPQDPPPLRPLRLRRGGPRPRQRGLCGSAFRPRGRRDRSVPRVWEAPRPRLLLRLDRGLRDAVPRVWEAPRPKLLLQLGVRPLGIHLRSAQLLSTLHWQVVLPIGDRGMPPPGRLVEQQGRGAIAPRSDEDRAHGKQACKSHGDRKRGYKGVILSVGVH
mmetsp:Transcript_66069/g.175994  ORF Transcript_66069/g.175994 Transcript_66069/m.175994 type:complete len:202 (-) Transcript_66069:40-645(-)